MLAPLLIDNVVGCKEIDSPMVIIIQRESENFARKLRFCTIIAIYFTKIMNFGIFSLPY